MNTNLWSAILLSATMALPAGASDKPVSTAPAAPATAAERDALRQEVWRAEEAFAKTMADRDFAAFQRFLSPEVVFWTQGVKRGPAEVAAAWRPLYEGPKAPFSWKPEAVEVLDSRTLALSSGPVFDPEGKRVSTLTSVWRREKDGRWLIVFDKGCPPCEGNR